MRKYVFYGLLFLCFSVFNVNLTAGDTNLPAKVKKINNLDTIPVKVLDSKVDVIIIDAGHGGYDGGTSGLSTLEKDITLRLALFVGKSIQARFPDLKIIYTRKRDVFVPLSERARIANEANADLFISIHCNAMPQSIAGRMIHGSETYVLGSTKKERNLAIAKRENEAIFLESGHADYDFKDSDSPEWHIFMSMYQQNYLEKSIQFADKVEKKFVAYGKRKSRGVLQNNFHVLREVAMPSVLIETGYLSNLSDEKYLKSEKGQDKVAQAISDAFYEYKTGIELDAPILINTAPFTQSVPLSPNTPHTEEVASSILTENTSIPSPVIKRRQKKVETSHKSTKKELTSPKPQIKRRKQKKSVEEPKLDISKNKPSSKHETTAYTSIKPISDHKEPKIIPVTHDKSTNQPKTKATKEKPVRKKQIVDLNKLALSPTFKIQLAASKNPIDASKFNQLSNIEVVYEAGFFKYLTGHTKHWSDITSVFKVLKNKGFNGFIVAYLNDQRIGLQEAREMSGN